MSRDGRIPNVNVTLGIPGYEPRQMAGKPFPCPVCTAHLDIRIARTGKPYCVCLECGIQVFVRGKVGISRLQRMIDNASAIAENTTGAHAAEVLLRRIHILKERKAALEQKQALFFPDADLEHAIGAIGNDIEQLQTELRTLAQHTGEDKQS